MSNECNLLKLSRVPIFFFSERRLSITFNARNAVDRSPETNQIIIFNSVIQNRGNAYDSVTGMFTTPVDGTYTFNVQVCTHSSKWAYFQLALDRMDNVILTVSSYNGDASYTTVSNSVSYYLTEGQRLWVKSYYNSGSTHTLYDNGNCWNQFSGALIHYWRSKDITIAVIAACSYCAWSLAYADPESFVRGVQLWQHFYFFFYFFLVCFISWWEDQNTTGHHRPASDDGTTLNAGLLALWFFRGSSPVLLRNPIFLWFFRGVQTPSPLPPLDPPMIGILLYSIITQIK